MISTEREKEPWTYDRLRHRLEIIINAIETHERSRDSNLPGGFLETHLLETIGDDLREIKAGLERWYGEGVFEKKPES